MIGTLLAAGLFVAMIVLLEVGRRLGARHVTPDQGASDGGLTTIDAAVFGLLGLLAAFTFSGAASRFDKRRDLAVEEANSIGTAYLRVDLLPPATQPALREDFRQYVDERRAAYRALPDRVSAAPHVARAAELQSVIWRQSIAGARDAPQATMLLVPALNAMIDVTTARAVAAESHAPIVILVLLVVVSLGSAVLAGYGTAGRQARSWVHVIGFAAIVSITVYVIIDLDYPRWGIIRIDNYDRLLGDVRAAMQ